MKQNQFNPMVLIGLTCLAILFFSSRRPDEGRRQFGLALNHSGRENTAEKEFDFNDLLAELIIIERKVSDSDATEDSIPSDIIYIVSGIFQESLTIESPDLRIIGWPLGDGERVVMITPGEIVTRIIHCCVGDIDEVTEICLEHFNKKSFRICPGANKKDTAGIAQFTMIRNELPGGVVQFSCELSDISQAGDQIHIRRVNPN